MIHVTIQQLSSYLDEQLNQGSADLVRQHLAECSECESRFGTLSRMDAALTRALSHDPGDDIFRRLEREIASALGPDAVTKAAEILGDAPAKASTPSSMEPKKQSSATPAKPSKRAPISNAGTKATADRVRDVPSTAWTPRVERGRPERASPERGATERGRTERATHAQSQDPGRHKSGSSAGAWVAVFSLAIIAGSVGVVVSHTGAVQGWLDGLISKPNFTVPKPGTQAVPNDPVTTELATSDSAGAAVDVMALIDPAPVPASESQTSHASLPPPPGSPRRNTSNELEPVDDSSEFTEEETTPQTMRADEVLASGASGSYGSGASARGHGGDRRDDPYAGLRPESQAAVREAERVHEQTLFHPTAEQFDVAAIRWERALEGLSGPEQVTIRGRLADARYRAWEAGPTATRADAAMSAIRSYLLFAPPGTTREEAKARLQRLDPR